MVEKLKFKPQKKKMQTIDDEIIIASVLHIVSGITTGVGQLSVLWEVEEKMKNNFYLL